MGPRVQPKRGNQSPTKSPFFERLIRSPPAFTPSAIPAPAHSLETIFEGLDALRRELTVAWSVFMNWRCRVVSTASMSGDHAVYALFMKMDDVKYGFFMRLGTHKTKVVAEL
jgi:hypothetical protein